MGPPRERGGSTIRTIVEPALPVLQWGRRVNAAEVSLWHFDRAMARSLQWGRRVNAAEVPEGRTYARESNVSSMGSPRERGGRPNRATGHPAGNNSSMGPPRERGGSDVSIAEGARVHVVFNGAAA